MFDILTGWKSLTFYHMCHMCLLVYVMCFLQWGILFSEDRGRIIFYPGQISHNLN